MIKESKKMEKNDSMVFLTEFKKLEWNLKEEIKCISERGKEILKFLKAMIANEKEVAKKVK